MAIKQCKICDKIKPEEKFGKYVKKDGSITRLATCYSCVKKQYLARPGNKDKVKLQNKIYNDRIRPSGIGKQRSAVWYSKNKDRHRQSVNDWRKKNPERSREIDRLSAKKRRSTPLGNFSCRLRNALRRAIRSLGIERSSTIELLGFSKETLVAHLFRWIDKPCIVCEQINIAISNCSIDHIVPLASAIDESDIVRLNQLSNLRLICRKCNAAKVKSDFAVILATRGYIKKAS